MSDLKLSPAFYAILKDKEVVEVDDIVEWGLFFKKPDRLLKNDKINESEVSTVFIGIPLGINHDSKLRESYTK